MQLDAFDFDLPAELIAQHPPAQRGEGRLLCLDAATGALADRRFADLPQLLRPDDVLVFNDTRVIKARLFGRKASGGRVELLIERVLDARHALALVRASHAPAPGSTLELTGGTAVRVLDREGVFHRLEFLGGRDVAACLDEHGEMPLPPYIERQADSEDAERYQTVYARTPGAVAAPTAGLHFDQAMLDRLREQGVALAFITLHVGAGTFQPVRSERIEEHIMHRERYTVPPGTVAAIERARANGGRVVAVGTTSLRALESAAAGGDLTAGSGETQLFVTPGYRFRIVEALLTNFHLPRSTLLMLVAAFAGLDTVLAAYRHAVAQRYRFFSYGDAMFIEGAPGFIQGAPGFIEGAPGLVHGAGGR
jgi:S-adenosylmethionine:tRNA ribosyltransferase-isomerase